VLKAVSSPCISFTDHFFFALWTIFDFFRTIFALLDLVLIFRHFCILGLFAFLHISFPYLDFFISDHFCIFEIFCILNHLFFYHFIVFLVSFSCFFTFGHFDYFRHFPAFYTNSIRI